MGAVSKLPSQLSLESVPYILLPRPERWIHGIRVWKARQRNKMGRVVFLGMGLAAWDPWPRERMLH